MSALPACPDKIADKPALLAGMLMQRDAEIAELVEALAYWLPDEMMIPDGHEAMWNKHIHLLAKLQESRHE